MDDEIKIRFVTDLDVNDTKKQINEIEQYLNKRTGKVIDEAVKLSKNKSLLIFKNMAGAYSASVFTTTNQSRKGVKGKVKKINGKAEVDPIPGFLTQEQAERLYQSGSMKTFIKNRNAVKDELEQQKTTARAQRRIKEQEAKKEREEEERQAKLQEKEELKKAKEKAEAQRRLKMTQLGIEWAQLTGENLPFGGELARKEAELRDLEERFYQLGEAGAEGFDEIKIKVVELSKEIANMKEKLKPSGFSKLFNTIKRVGFYRIARNLFRFAESGIGTGFKGLAEMSPEVNATLSSLMTNLQKIGNSLVIVIYPILKVIEPVLDTITQLVGKLAEGISYLAYQLGLTAHWFKLNTDYSKDFNNQMNKFSFDKFEALNSNDSSTGNMFVEMTGDDEQMDKLVDKLGMIASALALIVSIKFTSWLSDAIPKMKDFFKNASKLNTALGTMQIVLGSVALGFMAFFWIDSLLKKAPYWVRVLTLLAGALFLIASAVALATGQWSKAIAIPIIAVSAGVTLAGLKNTFGVTEYANGGLVDRGSLFIAGESGAELVTTMPSGQTGVTNVAQFKQAMLEALYEWGGGFSGDGNVVLNLDGAEIARSKRFTGEMNRRNAGLNLR